MPNDDGLNGRIKRMIVENLRLKATPEEIPDDQALFETFGLDSIDALELVAAMEKEFGVSVTSGDVDRKVFQNVGTIAAFVRENATRGV